MPRTQSKQSPVRWLDIPNKDQLFILALCRLSEPLSNTCLLPYMYYLIKSITSSDSQSLNAGEESRISKLSGVLVAAFPLAQFATSILWGRLSDSYGRKSIILLGLFVSAFSNLAFGLSRTFGALLFWRTLSGLANGNVVVMRTMTAEIVKEKYQTRAFLLLPLIFNSGMVAALALGGCLADPVINIPWLFGPQGLFNFNSNLGGVAWVIRYPYALPALFNATLLGLSLIVAVLYLRESLQTPEFTPDLGARLGASIIRFFRRIISKREAKYSSLPLEDIEEASSHHSESEPSTSSTPISGQKRPPFRAIWTPRVLAAILSFGLLPLHNAAYMHILPVYFSTPPSPNSNATLFSFTGGLGLHTPSIGLWLSLFGIGGILLQTFIYPRLQAALGTLGVFRIALFTFPITYALAPYLSLMAPGEALTWIAMALVVASQIVARTLAIPSTVILLTDAVEQKSVLGTVHGAGNMLSSLARAVGPAVGGLMYAWGVGHGAIGAAWWLWLLVIAMIALAASYLMKEDESS